MNRAGVARAALAGMGLVAISMATCARVRTPALPAGADLAAAFTRAAELEQRDPAAAVEALGDIVEVAAAGPAPGAEAALLAALEALVMGSGDALDLAGRGQGLAFRVPGALASLPQRLERAHARAGSLSAFAPAAVARAGLELALFDGDEAAAARWRARTGCVNEATIVGPVTWPALVGIDKPSGLEKPGAALPARLAGVGPASFSAEVAPILVRGCEVELMAGSPRDGVRLVAADVELARAEAIAVEIEGSNPAVLVIGGQIAARRDAERGATSSRTQATALAGPGRVRIVARVAVNGTGQRLRLAILRGDGSPLPARAPRPGQSAAGIARDAKPHFAAATAAPGSALRAAAELALGDGRGAARTLEAGGELPPHAPLAALLYARALTSSNHLPESRTLEVLPLAYARVRAGWPDAWEAIVGEASLGIRLRGVIEGRFEALAAVAAAHERRKLAPAAVAWQAVTAARADLRDRAETALAELATLVPGTPLYAQVERQVRQRVGAEREAIACRGAGLDRSGLDCQFARVARGDFGGGLAELTRLRQLYGSPDAFLRTEIDLRLSRGETDGVLAIYDRSAPADRSLGQLAALVDKQPEKVRARMERDAATAWDAPGVLPVLRSLLDKDDVARLAAGTEAIIAADRKASSATGAATLVLKHNETYRLDRQGGIDYTLYDVRRVSGTTDVDRGARMGPEMADGAAERQIVRRRIFKADGRVLDPDPISAGQQNAELSQLEPGDYLEEIVRGIVRPQEWGQLLVYTPDLLPRRTSVAEATIELIKPAGRELAVWAHPRFGAAKVARKGDDEIATYTLPASSPRRLEEDVPWPEAAVRVTFSTRRWEHLGQRLREAHAAFADSDPTVSRWARALGKAVEGKAIDDQAIIEAVVGAVGRVVKRADAGFVSGLFRSPRGPQRSNARHVLELGEGSRVLLAQRAFTELGLPAEVVLAESNPYPEDERHPAVYARFDKALLVVKTRQGRQVWLDLDVAGPPLPPDRVNPDLRGRQVLWPDGRITAIGGIDSRPTEVALALTLDKEGTARGTITVALRESTAERLAEELERTVGLPREQRLRAVVLGWLPAATVNTVALTSPKGSAEISLTAEVEVPGYAQAEGGGWVLPGLEPYHQSFPVSVATTLAERLARQHSRDDALVISTPQRYELRRRIVLPAPARLGGRAPALEESSAGLVATRSFALADGGQAVEERFALSLPTGIVAKNEYGKLVDAVTRIDSGFSAAARVAVRAVGRKPVGDKPLGDKPAGDKP